MKPVRRLIAMVLLAAFPAMVIAAQLLVLNKSDATLSFVDPVTGVASATIATGEGPHEIEVSTDGKLAFVSNYGSQTPGSTLSVVDVPTRKELERVELGELKRPHGLSIFDGYLYFTSEASKRIASYDVKSHRIDWQFDTDQNGTHMVLASRDGSKLFASNMGSNSVSVLERISGQWQQTLITVGAGPEGLDLSPNGRELWSAHSRDGGISIIDVTTKKVVKTFDAKTQRSNRLKFTPNGQLVLVSDLSGGELVVIDAKSHAEKARIKVGRTPTGILIAPDGKLAYVACSGSNFIAVVDLHALKVAKTFATGGSPDGMAWVR